MENNYNNDSMKNYEASAEDASYSYVSENNDTASPKKKKKHPVLKSLLFVLCMAIVGAGSIQGYKMFSDNNPKVSDFDESSAASQKKEVTNETDAAADNKADMPSLIQPMSRTDAISTPDIVEKVMPSVVGISSTFEFTASSMDMFSGFGYGFGFGYPSGGDTQTKQFVGTGTGIIISADGYIATNAHVVYDTESEYQAGEAIEVSVLLSDKSEHAAKIIAYDTQTDIAVLKIDETGLTPAEFGDSSDLKVGETVIAIGNPLGFDFFGSVTQGIVSALNRQISISDKSLNLIQTDTAINAGNSGGPLVNTSGQVIGINSAKMSSNFSSGSSIEGMGFAIPMDSAKSIIDDLINYKYVKGRPQIGISTSDITEDYASYFNLPMGVYVRSVDEGSAAEWAGIKEGDVIIGIDGEPVTTADELNDIKNEHKAGDKITINLYRNGEDMDIELVLQEANSQDPAPEADDEAAAD